MECKPGQIKARRGWYQQQWHYQYPIPGNGLNALSEVHLDLHQNNRWCRSKKTNLGSRGLPRGDSWDCPPAQDVVCSLVAWLSWRGVDRIGAVNLSVTVTESNLQWSRMGAVMKLPDHLVQHTGLLQELPEMSLVVLCTITRLIWLKGRAHCKSITQIIILVPSWIYTVQSKSQSKSGYNNSSESVAVPVSFRPLSTCVVGPMCETLPPYGTNFSPEWSFPAPSLRFIHFYHQSLNNHMVRNQVMYIHACIQWFLSYSG